MAENFSFSAKLDDKVSPNLGKIEGKLRSVQSALSNFVTSFKSSGDSVSSSSQKSTSKTVGSLGNLDQALKKSAENFTSLGQSAVNSSKKISEAVQSSLYGKGAEERLGELDEGLGKLGHTFSGMANRQKAVTGRARTLASTTKDSINKKVIPAFQQLHASLDEYPETLKEINKLESERFDILEKQPGLINKVNESMGKFGDKIKDIKFGLDDAMAVITAGYIGNVGLQVQEQQRGFAQTGGVGGFDELVETLRKTTALAQAPMSEVGPIIQTMRELKSISQEAMPMVAAGLFDLGKALNMTGEELAHFQDRMYRVQGLNENQFVKLTDDIAGIAHESSATSGELQGVIEALGTQMIGLSGDARLMYAKSSMAAAAAAKDAGFDMGTPQGFRARISRDQNAMNQFIGHARNAGFTGHPNELLATDDSMMYWATKGAKTHQKNMGISNAMLSGRDFRSGTVISQFERTSPFTPEMALREAKKTGAGTGGDFGATYMGMDYEGVNEQVSEKVRGTLTEILEQFQGTVQSGAIVSGEKTIRATATVTSKLEEMAAKGIAVFDKMDKKMGGGLSSMASIGIMGKAAFGLGNVVSGGKLGELSGGGGIKGLIKTVALVAVGAFAGKKLLDFAEGSEEAAKAQEKVASNSTTSTGAAVVKEVKKLSGNELTTDVLKNPAKYVAKGLEVAQGSVNKIAEMGRELFDKYKTQIKEFLGNFMNFLGDTFKKIQKIAVPILKSIFESAKNLFSVLKDQWPEIKKTMKNMWEGTKDVFKSIWSVVKDLWAVIKNNKEEIKLTLKWVGNKIMDLVKATALIIKVTAATIERWTGILAAMSSLNKKIKDFWADVFDVSKLTQIFKDFWSGFLDTWLHRNDPAPKKGEGYKPPKNIARALIEKKAAEKGISVEEYIKQTQSTVPKTAGGISAGGTDSFGTPSFDVDRFSAFRSMGEGFVEMGGGSPRLDGSNFSSLGEAANARPVGASGKGAVSHRASIAKTKSIQESRMSKSEQLGQSQLSIQEQMLSKLTVIAQNSLNVETKKEEVSPAAVTQRNATPGELQGAKIGNWQAGKKSYGGTLV